VQEGGEPLPQDGRSIDSRAHELDGSVEGGGVDEGEVGSEDDTTLWQRRRRERKSFGRAVGRLEEQPVERDRLVGLGAQ
jgi:hypothetical protein